MDTRRIGSRMIPAVVLGVAIVFLAGGCRLDRRVVVTAHLPELPMQWRGIVAGFLIEWRCARGDRESVEAPVNAAVRVALPVGTPSAVIFRPIPVPDAASFEFLPAGALYPSGEHDVVTAEWVDGAAAVIIDRIAAHGVVRYLNAARLFREVRERSGDDPWALDLDLIVERLAAGGFRVTDLRRIATRSVITALPAGTWISPNPFTAPIRLGPTGGVVTRDLPYGVHPLLSLPAHDVVTAFVTRDGTYTY